VEEKGKWLEAGVGWAPLGDAFEAGVAAAGEALRQIRRHPLSAALVFASARFDLVRLLEGIAHVSRDAPLLGGTTAGEILNGPKSDSVVVILLASPFLKVRVGVGKDALTDWEVALHKALSSPELKPFFGEGDSRASPWQQLTQEGESIFGMLFSPGGTRHEDTRAAEILEEIKRIAPVGFPVVGACSAHDRSQDRSAVFAGKEVHWDSLLLALFQTSLRFGMAVAHGFRPTSHTLLVTKARDHEVLTIDHRPAAEVYARLCGREASELLGRHVALETGIPLGLRDAFGQYFLIVPTYMTSEGGLRISQPVGEGVRLTLMKASDKQMVEAGEEALRKALLRGQITRPALILSFACSLRSTRLGRRSEEEIQGIRKLAQDAPVAGFYAFGEQGLCDDGLWTCGGVGGGGA